MSCVYDESSESDESFTENPDSPIMASTPKHLLVSTDIDINADASVHPSKKTAKKATNKICIERCLPKESSNNHQHIPEKDATKEKSPSGKSTNQRRNFH